jgi:hypothetical protein
MLLGCNATQASMQLQMQMALYKLGLVALLLAWLLPTAAVANHPRRQRRQRKQQKNPERAEAENVQRREPYAALPEEQHAVRLETRREACTALPQEQLSDY